MKTELPHVDKNYSILMIAPTMFFADYGGHIRILEESKVLRKLGHQVTILTYPNGRDIANLNIRRCLGVPFNYRVMVGSSRHKYYLDIMLTLKAIQHVLRNKPDVIHAHMHEGALIGWLLSKITGAPLIFDFQGSLTGEMLEHNFVRKEQSLFRLFQWLEHVIDHKPKAILTSSQHGANLLRDNFGVSAGLIHPTPDCVETDTFNPASFTPTDRLSLKQSLGIPLEKKLIVYVGVLTQYQGIDHLLQALQIIRQQRNDFHLLLMGYPAVRHYQMIAESLEVADLVTFTGMIPYETLPSYLAIGDIATAPKLSATEGCGKILNYMSMALPTVVFNTPVSREFLGVHGLYAEDYTPEALAQALNHALNLSPQQRKTLGTNLRHMADNNFSWDRTGKQIELVYAAVLAGHPQPAWVVREAAI